MSAKKKTTVSEQVEPVGVDFSQAANACKVILSHFRSFQRIQEIIEALAVAQKYEIELLSRRNALEIAVAELEAAKDAIAVGLESSTKDVERRAAEMVAGFGAKQQQLQADHDALVAQLAGREDELRVEIDFKEGILVDLEKRIEDEKAAGEKELDRISKAIAKLKEKFA